MPSPARKSFRQTLTVEGTFQLPQKYLILNLILRSKTEEVTNAENIKADRPKILRPTHFKKYKVQSTKYIRCMLTRHI
jgi:hypothetical protein